MAKAKQLFWRFMIRSLLGLVLSTFVSAKFATSEQLLDVGENADSNCGKLLITLTTRCAHLKLSQLEPCCDAIVAWNRGLCWCEPNAFNSAANLAMDYFAFQFRTKKCNMTSTVFHPEITLPVAEKSKLEQTCPALLSVPESETSEGCSSVSPRKLRQQRLESLHLLNSDNVLSNEEIQEWSERMDGLLVPGASLFSVGKSFLFPRINVKRYLLSRTSLANGALWKSAIDTETIFWRSVNQVSYSSAYTLGPYSFAKIEFVTFERCSARIQHIYSQEEEGVLLFKQFVYVEPSDRGFWEVQLSPRELCIAIGRVCRHDLFPFQTKEHCLEIYSKFEQEDKVTCGSGSPSFSVIALHGNTSTCRGMYLRLASIDSKTYCRFLGEKGIGICRQSGCPEGAYNNVFREENPRFDSTAVYSCSRDGCSEAWPYEDDTEEV